MCKKGLPLPLEHRDAISRGLKRYYAIYEMSQERKDAISEGKRKYYATHKMTKAHKDAISHGVNEYYSTHDGPWKGVKRSKEFKESVSRTLRRTYENGHTSWNKGLRLPEDVKERIGQGVWRQWNVKQEQQQEVLV